MNRPILRCALSFLAFAAVAGCAAGSTPGVSANLVGSGPGSGTLFIVGGGAQPPELVARFVELAGANPRIAVVPMASGSAEEGGREKAEQLRGLGADAFSLNITKEQANSDSVVRLIESATGIWFGGGDQARLTAVLRGTAALRAIHARYRAGAVVGGTSAGAAIMSDSMITGDQIRPGEDTVGYFGDEFPRIARKTIVIAPGFGFLPSTIVDQHFVRRERHNRLISAVLERPTMLGVGIDESTALRVDPDGRWAVEGASTAVIYDARAAEVTPPGVAPLGASSVRLHILPAGSTFDPGAARARLPGN